MTGPLLFAHPLVVEEGRVEIRTVERAVAVHVFPGRVPVRVGRHRTTRKRVQENRVEVRAVDRQVIVEIAVTDVPVPVYVRVTARRPRIRDRRAVVNHVRNPKE